MHIPVCHNLSLPNNYPRDSTIRRPLVSKQPILERNLREPNYPGKGVVAYDLLKQRFSARFLLYCPYVSRRPPNYSIYLCTLATLVASGETKKNDRLVCVLPSISMSAKEKDKKRSTSSKTDETTVQKRAKNDDGSSSGKTKVSL